jgi:hypothetical protein
MRDYKRMVVFWTVVVGKHEVRRPLFFEDPHIEVLSQEGVAF